MNLLLDWLHYLKMRWLQFRRADTGGLSPQLWAKYQDEAIGCGFTEPLRCKLTAAQFELLNHQLRNVLVEQLTDPVSNHPTTHKVLTRDDYAQLCSDTLDRNIAKFAGSSGSLRDS